jgi:hypothetical protein
MRLLLFLITLATFAGVQVAPAAIIAQRTGNLSGVFVNSPTTIVWTQTNTFTDVSISALLSSLLSSGNGQGTLFLTTQIGPGTTTDSEVARVSVTGIPRATQVSTLLFSGLTLGPGTYYLTKVGTGEGGLGWGSLNGFTTTTAPGVTILPTLAGNSPEAYAPATNVLPVFVENLGFSITGTLVDTQVPEPSSAVLMIGGMLALGYGVRRKRAA